MSEFWKYFRDTLVWPLIHAPGPLSAVAKGAALALDLIRDDVVAFRRQWFPALCEPDFVPAHGKSRGLVRHPKESPEQFQQRVVNAYAWHLLGGKTKGLPEILTLYGFPVHVIENMRDDSPMRWAEFQLGFHFSDPQEQRYIIDNFNFFVWVINEYKPARSVLFRMYSDTWDMRPAIYSHKYGYSESYYSFYSGVPVPGGDGEDVIVSFGNVRRTQAEKLMANVFAGIERTRGALCPHLDRLIYGYSCYSDVPIRNHGFTRYRLRQMEYPHVPTYFVFGRSCISRVQAVYGESIYGDTNSRYGRPVVTLIDAPAVYGQSPYSADQQRRTFAIDEIFIRKHSHHAPMPQPSAPLFHHADREGVHAAAIQAVFPENARWTGRWDKRTWRAFGAQTNFTRSDT